MGRKHYEKQKELFTYEQERSVEVDPPFWRNVNVGRYRGGCIRSSHVAERSDPTLYDFQVLLQGRLSRPGRVCRSHSRPYCRDIDD